MFHILNRFSIHVNRKMPTIFGMKTEFSLQFGALLKALRQERKISQQKLAEAAGVERNYVYYLERGDSEPTLGVLMGLAYGLGMSFKEFAALIEALPDAQTNRK
ncbi:MAG: helix-turn-helix domain-containing protein, partial [Deltaproteobacteria bacterium]|nr:helix-turn-helix domain-containing protein [Deltaproteobacteria bacterium]